MYFAGRLKEIAQASHELVLGNNLIIAGKYGIGRTALLRRLAEQEKTRRRYAFADFSRSRADVCRELLAQLFPKLCAERFGEYQPYKWARYRVAKHPLKDKRQHVLVLDNIAKLTAQKLDLIHYIEFEKRFRFVAIVEDFLHPDQLFLLRAALIPVSTLRIEYLDTHSVREYFCHYAEKSGLDWTDEEIDTLVEAAGGYPLRMEEIAARAIQRRRNQWKAKVQRA